jgi:tetratricopeptide (TPR) repeat protein
MNEKEPFRFEIPNLPPGKRVTKDEAEVLLQARLREKQAEFEVAIWRLVEFYSKTKRQRTAWKYVGVLMSLTDDAEKQAYYWLTLGRLMEQIKDYRGAIDYYKQALSMEPAQSETWYFINNNLAFSLLQIGLFEEAEPYCRAAIKIDPSRHNAHKNLGISLQGRGKNPGAALSYLQAIRTNSADPRALAQLESLLAEHPDLLSEVDGLRDQLEKSREMVDLATRLTASVRKGQMDRSSDLTHAARLLIAVGRLLFLEGRSEFSVEDVQRALGLSMDEWMSGFALLFRGMGENKGGAPSPVDEDYCGVFKEARQGVYTLTDHGLRVVHRIHKM